MAKTPKTDTVDTPAADVIADLGNAALSPEAAEALAKVAPPAAAAEPAAKAEPAQVTVSRPSESVKRSDDKNAVDKSAITARAVVKTPDGFTVRNR